MEQKLSHRDAPAAAAAKPAAAPGKVVAPAQAGATRPACSFDYQVWVGGRWLAVQSCQDEQAAIAQAQRDIIEGHQHKVRVLKVEAGGSARPAVVFERELELPDEQGGRNAARPPVNSPLCHDPHDLFEPAARLTLNRMLAEYCREHELTVTELLHNRQRLDKLLARTGMVGDAINRVARQQAKSRQLVMKRRQALMDMVQNARDICYALPHPPGQKQAEAEVESICDRLAAGNLPTHESANLRRRLGAAVNVLIYSRRDARERMIFLLELLERSTHTALDRIIDMLLADIIYSTELSEKLTGLTSNLGEKLIRLLRLSEGAELDESGKRPTSDPELNVAIAQLRLSIRQRRLPVFRQHLIDRVTTMLEEAPALESRDNILDDALYRQIVETSGRYFRLLEEPNFVEAITRRFSRHTEIAASNISAAARNVAVILQQPGIAILYWANLYKLVEDIDLRRQLIGHIREALEVTLDLNILLPMRIGHRARLARMKAAHDAIAKMPIAPEWRRDMLSLIDEAMWQYIAQQGFFSDPGADKETLRDRAFRMVDFCLLDLLPEGKALNHVHDRLRKLIRQDDFDERFTSDIADPVMAEAARRAFDQKLRRLGLRGQGSATDEEDRQARPQPPRP